MGARTCVPLITTQYMDLVGQDDDDVPAQSNCVPVSTKTLPQEERGAFFVSGNRDGENSSIRKGGARALGPSPPRA